MLFQRSSLAPQNLVLYLQNKFLARTNAKASRLYSPSWHEWVYVFFGSKLFAL